MERGTIIDHVERLRAKPEHVRRRIAIGTTFGITGLVAAVWLFAIVASGSLVLNPFVPANATTAFSNTPDTSGDVVATGDQGTQNSNPVSQLLGAVGAAGGTSNTPALDAVDVSTTSTTNTDPIIPPTGGDQTVIPF